MAVVLLTGCSSGFGLASAVAFARAGHTVVATMRDPTRRARLDALLVGDQQLRVDVEQLDVTDPISRERVIADTVERHGRIDVLVNNAGLGHIGPALPFDEPLLLSLLATNLVGPIAMCSLAVPHMQRQGAGRIVNVTSMAALHGAPSLVLYGASKHALEGYSIGLDLEVARFGIRVVTVAPAAYATDMLSNATIDRGRAESDAAIGAVVDTYVESIRTNTDLAPVVDAILHAALDDTPALCTPVGAAATAVIGPVAAARDRAHALMTKRFGPLGM